MSLCPNYKYKVDKGSTPEQTTNSMMFASTVHVQDAIPDIPTDDVKMKSELIAGHNEMLRKVGGWS